jgi:hypothetical protein
VSEFALSEDARSTAGILLLTLVAVEYGGTFTLRCSMWGRDARGEKSRSLESCSNSPAHLVGSQSCGVLTCPSQGDYCLLDDLPHRYFSSPASRAS